MAKTVGDKIYIRSGEKWQFNKNVAKNFKKHVNKSIPLYEDSHEIIKKISDIFLKNNSVCYDLGCSLGNLIKDLAKRHKKKRIKFFGIDSSKDMIIEANKTNKDKRIVFLNNDLENLNLDKSNLIVCHYSLQFTNIKKRQKIINNIYKSLRKNGCLLLFEKIIEAKSNINYISNSIYDNFKIQNGYSKKEIKAKKLSLKGILKPQLNKNNINLLKRAGFSNYEIIFKYTPFVGYIAIK